MKTRTTLTVEKAILEKAHQQGVNISRFLEDALRSYLEGNGPQQQPQPNMNLKTLFPAEALEKLKAYGFDDNDNEWLRRVIKDSLQKTIVELGFEVYDKRADTYVLLE